MKILGIDTTTKSASCTILNENRYYTKDITNEITHSEKLLPIIHETLTENKITLDDIDVMAAINGPGSFTGIRIGLATIKAFAQVKNIDIFSISSIDLISYVAFKNLNVDKARILSLIDARNNRVYYSINTVYKNDNGKIVIHKETEVENDLIDDVIAKLDLEKVAIAGNCIDTFKEKLASISEQTYNFYPTTEDLIDCYLNIEEKDNYMYNAYSLDALYARPSQAERMSK